MSDEGIGPYLKAPDDEKFPKCCESEEKRLAKADVADDETLAYIAELEAERDKLQQMFNETPSLHVMQEAERLRAAIREAMEKIAEGDEDEAYHIMYWAANPHPDGPMPCEDGACKFCDTRRLRALADEGENDE